MRSCDYFLQLCFLIKLQVSNSLLTVKIPYHIYCYSWADICSRHVGMEKKEEIILLRVF